MLRYGIAGNRQLYYNNSTVLARIGERGSTSSPSRDPESCPAAEVSQSVEHAVKSVLFSVGLWYESMLVLLTK